jgi:lysozyme
MTVVTMSKKSGPSRSVLINELIRDEGLKLKPYRCTAGKLTIGIGRNIEDRGISKPEAMMLLNNDIDIIEGELDRAIPWWRELDEPRQRALVNMAFMGVPRLMGFKRMLAALKDKDFRIAADEALRSQWAGQVGRRATRVADLIRHGKESL